LLLDADACKFPQNVQAVRKVLELNKFHLPVATLLRNDRLQSDGGVAMSPSTIMEDDVNSFHWQDCATNRGELARARSMPCG
jgi:hypothetical protein